MILLSCARPNYKEIPSPEIPQSNTPNQDSNANQKPETECKFILIKEKLCVSITWTKFPTTSEYGSLELNFQPINQEINSATTQEIATQLLPKLSVILWMPSMGHGSVPVKLEASSASTIKVTNVFFIMPGDWEIRIQLKEGNEIYDQIIYSLFI